MIKTIQKTCTTATAASGMVVELGFVPDRVTIRNRTTLYSLEWTQNTDTHGYVTTSTGSVTYVSAAALTLIDGSDKVNYTDYSYGFLIPVITDLQDASGEILDITAERSDI